MKLRRKHLVAVVEVLREAQAIKPPRGPVTAASVERAADRLLRAALLKRKPKGTP